MHFLLKIGRCNLGGQLLVPLCQWDISSTIRFLANIKLPINRVYCSFKYLVGQFMAELLNVMKWEKKTELFSAQNPWKSKTVETIFSFLLKILAFDLSFSCHPEEEKCRNHVVLSFIFLPIQTTHLQQSGNLYNYGGVIRSKSMIPAHRNWPQDSFPREKCWVEMIRKNESVQLLSTFDCHTILFGSKPVRVGFGFFLLLCI